MNDNYLKSNRELWDAWTRLHVKSKFYDVDGFKAGKIRLDSVVRENLGDVAGKSLLHLQCHFGLDTLSWARLGARVTGADFSEEAIAQARTLSAELSIPANFVCANIYDLPSVLSGEFDIVFASHGVLPWLPDLQTWAKVIAHFLWRGGAFYIVESHPFAHVFDNGDDATDLRVCYHYFESSEPIKCEANGSYADRDADCHITNYQWDHSMSELLNALLSAGLQIEYLREYPFLAWKMFAFMEQDADGWWRLPKRFNQIPLMFSLKAIKK
jgi:SAM-dependent methyltransferase